MSENDRIFFHYDFIILIDFLSRFISYFDIDHNKNYINFISFLLRNFSQMMKHYIERVVDWLPLMTYGLKLSLEAWILKFKNFNLSFKEIISSFK